MAPTMAETRSQNTERLVSMLRTAAADLSPKTINALIAHPDAVRGALAAAGALLIHDARGALVHDGIEIIGRRTEPRFSPEEAKQIIERHTVALEQDEEVLNSDQVAARLRLKSRQSVHDWRRKGKILGWQHAKRGYLFPARQFDERNEPIEGLAEVATLFAHAYSAWLWLTTPRNSLDGAEPLDLLAGGERERVIDAAKGHLQGDFA